MIQFSFTLYRLSGPRLFHASLCLRRHWSFLGLYLDDNRGWERRSLELWAFPFKASIKGRNFYGPHPGDTRRVG